jgi:hypothetical protein
LKTLRDDRIAKGRQQKRAAVRGRLVTANRAPLDLQETVSLHFLAGSRIRILRSKKASLRDWQILSLVATPFPSDQEYIKASIPKKARRIQGKFNRLEYIMIRYQPVEYHKHLLWIISLVAIEIIRQGSIN